MSRIILLGIIAVATLVIAPFVGAFGSVGVDPDRALSPLARTIFDASEEGELGEAIRDRREENEESGRLEERRDDGREFFENKEEE
ncbi:MAG TPA: hypothetical protein ACFCUY_13010 [Xenococcaceae cyanobacterium]